MRKIFFLSPTGYAPLKQIRNLISGSHGWTWVDTSLPGPFPIWGVAIPDINVDAMEVVDALTALGVLVLPSVHDATPIPAAAATALAIHGVLATDTAFECAQKLYAKCGMPMLRPHRY